MERSGKCGEKLHRKICGFPVFVAALMIVVPTLAFFRVSPAEADHSASGTVAGPTSYSHTVKCRPGDTIQVSVTSDYPTSVNVIALTPLSGEWGVDAVAVSSKKTSHSIRHSAPAGKPKNNASHWHFKVSVLASTHKTTKFSLKITQRGSGNLPDAYIAQAKRQLQSLGKAIQVRKSQLETAAKSRIDRIKTIDEEREKMKSSIDAGRAELRRIEQEIRSEKDKAVRSSMRQRHEQKRASVNRMIIAYNNLGQNRKALVSDLARYTGPYEEVESLRKSLAVALSRNDYDRCVIIANGSRTAIELGWKVLRR